MRFSPFFRTIRRRTGGEGAAGSGQLAVEDGGAAWQRPVAPSPGLGLASDGPLSWSAGLGMAKDGARHGAAGDRGAAALAEHAHGAWRRSARCRRSGPAAVAISGAAGSVLRTKDSSSLRGMAASTRQSGRRRGMEAATWRIGMVKRPHSAVKPRWKSAE